MKSLIFGVLVVLAALASVLLSEISMMPWLASVPFDATGNFFLGAILPAELITVGIMTLLLTLVYKHNARVYMSIYAVVFCLAHAAELNMNLNPWADIAAYLAGILIACAVWFAAVVAAVHPPILNEPEWGQTPSEGV